MKRINVLVVVLALTMVVPGVRGDHVVPPENCETQPVGVAWSHQVGPFSVPVLLRYNYSLAVDSSLGASANAFVNASEQGVEHVLHSLSQAAGSASEEIVTTAAMGVYLLPANRTFVGGFGATAGASATAAWADMTPLTCVQVVETFSQTTLTTAVDPYLPFLIFGGLALVFVYFLAWAPAMGSLVALGANLFTPPLVGLPGQIMLVMVLVVLHGLVAGGVLPKPWGRRQDGGNVG